RLPRRVRAAGAARVRGRHGREPACLRPVLATLARSPGGRPPPAHAGARSLAPRGGRGTPGRHARRRARPRTPGAARSGRGGAEPAGPSRHGAAPSLSLRGARPAGRLPAGEGAPLDAGGRPGVVATTESQRDRAVALLAGHGLALTPTSAPFPQALSAPGRALLALVGELTRGVWLPADRLALVTESEIFGERRQVRRGPRARPADFLSTLAELKPNDYVVHVDHGIGIYRGLRHMQVADTEGDYLHLEYAGGDRFYLPVDRINLVQRYVSADSAAPPLDKLGGTSWERVKAKTRESLLAMAQELVQVYAAREAHGRAAYQESDG